MGMHVMLINRVGVPTFARIRRQVSTKSSETGGKVAAKYGGEHIWSEGMGVG